MVIDIYTKWARNKKILLLVDCPTRRRFTVLRRVTLVFLSPNMTSVLQPLEQGIVRAMK